MRELKNSISAGGHVRREQKSGREYAVFPTVIAREMVLNYPEFGRDEYLPAESLQNSVEAWADVPITVNHPPDRGEGRTAKTPESYTSEVIGRLFNPELVGDDDRIRGEAWIDIEKANDLGGEYEVILNSLLDGEEIGVSTGYATVGDEIREGVFNGEEYELKQGDIIPNHLALLTDDKTPRMSPEQGVGAPRLNHIPVDSERVNVLSEARTPNYDGTESRSWGDISADTLSHYTTNLDIEGESWDDLDQSERQQVVGHTLLGEASADSADEALVFPVVNASTGNVNEGALDAVISGRGESANIPEESRSSAQSVARRLLADEFDREVDRENTTNATDTVTTSDETSTARKIGAAFREAFGLSNDDVGRVVANVTGESTVRTNQQTGDAVRWDSDSGGPREPDSVRYGVVVDGLTAEDEPDDSLLVAVYRADSDREGWENTGDQEVIQEDRLEVVGNNGKESLPSVSDVVTNTVDESADDGDSTDDLDTDADTQDSEADDSDEADPESAAETTTDTDDADAESNDTTDENTMSNDNERIERLAQDEDVPFDEAVLSEFDDNQLDTIDPEIGGGQPDEDEDEAEAEDEVDEDEQESDSETPETTETTDSPDSPGEDDVSEVEEKVNALEERFEQRINELEQENEELRKKADPDVVERMNAIQTLAEHYDTSTDEFESLSKERAVQMANDISDDDTRENAFGQAQQQAQQKSNMIGVPGAVDRTNSEDDLDDIPAAGREAWEARQQND